MPFSFTLQPAPQADGKRLEHADLTLGPVSATYLLDATRGQPLRARCAARWAFTGCRHAAGTA